MSSFFCHLVRLSYADLQPKAFLNMIAMPRISIPLITSFQSQGFAPGVILDEYHDLLGLMQSVPLIKTHLIWKPLAITVLLFYGVIFFIGQFSRPYQKFLITEPSVHKLWLLSHNSMANTRHM